MLVKLPLVAAAAFATAATAAAVPATDDVAMMKKNIIQRLERRASNGMVKRNSLTTGADDATILNFALTLEVRSLSC